MFIAKILPDIVQMLCQWAYVNFIVINRNAVNHVLFEIAMEHSKLLRASQKHQTIVVVYYLCKKKIE